MASSAFINTPPANDRDLFIAIGMLLDAGITAGMRDPSEGVAMRPSRPDDYIFETKAPGIIAGSAICIFVMLLVTSTRFLLRIYLPRLKWGLDDTLLVPGVVMAIAYSALQVAMALKGGAGKHIFDVTYLEYYHYKWYANIAQIGYGMSSRMK
ncbi:uncharacterized protein HMPREF1541_03753 [Cyphellophora europaea CBS 101466]|uniref:Rhodopsin domain-containing protein n=1 Tax=Cyphellophora europaea (strain CBS 101466) TaxID=1220924 RepID=W2RZ92_CYPE1|nr:uncharacterized protein HMPREF1541_03753 [Cyphellophora europaea CBS 101466]ETN41816.1 hypothetical protein HMPREF1541_03753 [Cyphellophora europaea CBS 101466]